MGGFNHGNLACFVFLFFYNAQVEKICNVLHLVQVHFLMQHVQELISWEWIQCRSS
jgi:hypothetical protein